MNSQARLSLIAHGEDSTRQFKADVTNGKALASEMAAFANTEGETILNEALRRRFQISDQFHADELPTRAVEKQLMKLRPPNRLQRVGPARGGRWEIIEKE